MSTRASIFDRVPTAAPKQLSSMASVFDRSDRKDPKGLLDYVQAMKSDSLVTGFAARANFWTRVPAETVKGSFPQPAAVVLTEDFSNTEWVSAMKTQHSAKWQPSNDWWTTLPRDPSSSSS